MAVIGHPSRTAYARFLVFTAGSWLIKKASNGSTRPVREAVGE